MKIAKQQVVLLDSMGSDLSVVNAARVSFHKQSEWELYNPFDYLDNDPSARYDPESNMYAKLSAGDKKLIAYLAKHNHWSPFSHCFAQFRIKAPIFVARQLVKHQVGLAWNEVSRRYVDDGPEFYFPDVWRGKPVNAKQGSTGIIDKYDFNAFRPVMDSLDLYNEMLNAGVAPEQARMVLPQNTMTEWIWSGSLAAWARVCKLRLDSHAQLETQEIAQHINKEMEKLFPVSWKALTNVS